MCKEIIISDLKTREEVTNIITAIAGSADDQYPELIRARTDKYRDDIILFANLIKSATANSTSKCNSRLKIRLLSEVRQKPPVAV